MEEKLKTGLAKKKKAAKTKAKAKTKTAAQDLELDEEEITETPEERAVRLYEKAKKKMGFAPNMYRREDQSDMYRQAADLFGQLEGYEESGQLGELCQTKAAELWQLYVTETCDHVKEQLAVAKTLIQCQRIRDELETISADRDVSDLLEACAALEQKIQKKQTLKRLIKILMGIVVILVIAIAFYFIQHSVRVEMGL